jgi:hypothetical protein
MSPKAEILFEGTYLYFQKDVNYSQENFKLISLPETQTFQIYAEIVSRIETGEFLKIIVRYEMNQHFVPNMARIEKSIGNRYAQEIYKIDTAIQELHYTFQNSQTTQEFHKPFNSKHYLTSPALSTAGLFTLTKKFDPTGRTAVVLLSSENEWTYLGPPTEKIVYVDFKVRNMEDFKLHGNALTASHLCLYEQDSSASSSAPPVDLFISKHFGIPYQLLQGDLKIVIKNLKKN